MATGIDILRIVTRVRHQGWVKVTLNVLTKDVEACGYWMGNNQPAVLVEHAVGAVQQQAQGFTAVGGGAVGRTSQRQLL